MPNHPSDRRGFSNVVQTLDEILDEVEKRGERSLAADLVRIVNDLRPSKSGAFEGFETALRAQQLAFARCPNPSYDRVEFTIPKAFAEAVIERLPPEQGAVVRKAVDSFLSTQATAA